jgi:hypothetical protein
MMSEGRPVQELGSAALALTNHDKGENLKRPLSWLRQVCCGLST